MRIVIVTEKPYMARRIAQAAQPLFPNDTLDHLICWQDGLYEPVLPRGLRWNDYPYIAPFELEQFQRRTQRVDLPMRGPMIAQPLQSPQDPMTFDENWSDFNERLAQADQIILLMDPSASMYHFDVARRRALGQGVAPGEARLLYSLDEEATARALTQPSAEQDAQAQTLIAYGQVRRYFNHQFALNSLAILGRMLGDGGGWVSKYQLQMLYLLRDLPPATESGWLKRMQDWKGTGRYPSSPDHWYCQLGSTMSRAAIFQQIHQHGWIAATDPNDRRSPLTLSEAGRALLEKLHPGCEDADLPFRLDAWARQGLAGARPAMDRYLRTFFGRQKRRLDQARH